ncbi:ethanolaminephosphotransferase 1-like [Bradysia coprophila]|uniref:ethanolaminephosphotransferase 1-like n=1 Tax=Bradysia coprophila TaxID=38358 RepID=UPI00187DB323|nr:ethanolaminephosphotransferase 1-like [Bradysia coprophila]
MFRRKYLSDVELERLATYKYTASQTPLLCDNVMRKFYIWCINYIPLWMAPNLLTFTGFFLNVANFCLTAYYDFDLDATSHPIDEYPIPRWVFLVVSINFFLAYTIDNIDGAQARRTGSASPLGEVIDHGLDVYSANFIMGYIFSLFGRIDFPVMWMHLVTFTIYLSFYLPFFAQYHTKVLAFPQSYHMVMFGCTLAPLAAFMFGPQIYIRDKSVPKLSVPTYKKIIYISSVFANYPMVAWNIYKSYRDKTGHMRSFHEALKPLYTFFGFFIVATAWGYYSPNRILELHPRIFFLVTGTIFTNFCTRLIVAQMTKTAVNGWNHQLTLYTVAVIVCVAPYQMIGLPMLPMFVEKFILLGLFLFSKFVHIHYAYGMINELCDYLGIRCFTINSKSKTR